MQKIDSYHSEIKDKPIDSILKWAYGEFGAKLGMTTGGGYSGVVLMHRIYELGLDIDVYFIDTGYHFPETIEFVKTIQDLWDLKVQWVRPDSKVKNYLSESLGDKPWDVNSNFCCHCCKVGPLIKVLPEKDAWISAIRRDQTHTRSALENIELDGRGTLKIYPLAYWDKEKAWKYIKDNKLPYNPLHDKGYMSLGCLPCTASVGEEEDEREGRWKSTPKFDCGIHSHNRPKL